MTGQPLNITLRFVKMGYRISRRQRIFAIQNAWSITLAFFCRQTMEVLDY